MAFLVMDTGLANEISKNSFLNKFDVFDYIILTFLTSFLQNLQVIQQPLFYFTFT